MGEGLVASASKDWHSLEVGEVLAKLSVDPSNGLSEEEAQRRLRIYGPNELERPAKASPLKIFLKQFTNVLILILIAATALSSLLGEALDALLISAIVLIATVLGFAQEYRAERTVEALRRMLSPKARVVRGGLEKEVEARDIVPGDVLALRAGDRVAADGRVIESAELQVDESALTGESVPVAKDPHPNPPNTVLAERTSMVFAGAMVTYGKGRAVVTSTGMSTEMGKIAREAAAIRKEKTPLEVRMDELGKKLSLLLMAVIVAIATASLVEETIIKDALRGEAVAEVLLFAAALAVAAIPEALPAIVAGTLAVGAYIMAKHGSLIRRMPAVETLGATQVICTDKTGTLTKGEMTVKAIYVPERMVEVIGVGYEPKGGLVEGNARATVDKALRLALTAGALCNDAELTFKGGRWQVNGDPTEGALLVAAIKAGLDVGELRRSSPRVREAPFSSERKMMSTVHRSQDGTLVVYTKGAAEVVLKGCSGVLAGHRLAPLTDEDRARILRVNDLMAANALRVIAVAYKEISEGDLSSSDEWLESGLIFLGLFGMIDPPREEAIKAVDLCKQTYVKPVMITGDHKLTAMAVGKAMGIFKDGDPILTGDDLEGMSEDELIGLVEKVSVYARVSPIHKLKIVRAWKSKGFVVAMTGDGVNDAPALKHADIGVAMGVTGTDVAKEAADMILLDDNFATIVKAVELGRWIYDNIKKYLTYLLEANIVEVMVMAALVLMGFPLPLSAAHLLYINVATDGLPALAVGLAPPDPDLMRRPPRHPRESVFSREVRTLLTLIALVDAPLLIWVFAANAHRGLEVARTLLFLTFIGFELAIALSMRSLKHPIFKVKPHRWLVLAVMFQVALTTLIVATDVTRQLFKLAVPTLGDVLLISAISVAPFVAIELTKALAPNLLMTKGELQLLRGMGWRASLEA